MLVATLIVMAVAGLEVWRLERIGAWTGVTLVTVSVVSALITRPGDRSLPAMMPPLAFVACILTAGQVLLPTDDDALWQREAVLILETLGENALWILAATASAVAISATRHFFGR